MLWKSGGEYSGCVYSNVRKPVSFQTTKSISIVKSVLTESQLERDVLDRRKFAVGTAVLGWRRVAVVHVWVRNRARPMELHVLDPVFGTLVLVRV